jgi:hypothetical protein
LHIDIKQRFADRLGFGQAITPDEQPEQAEKAKGPRNGPVKLRHVTSGQMRRAEARWRRAQIRKTNLRHRRDWHRNQQAIANLRGQIGVIDAGPNHPLYEGVADRLYAAYGSVDKARELHEEIQTKQAEARVQQALAELGKR